MVLSDERLREKLAQRTRLRNSYMPGSYNYEVEDEIVSAFTELLTRRAAEQQEPDARRKVSLLWLDGYLAELKKTPNRFADDIWELEQIREQFAASPQPPVPPGEAEPVVKPLEWEGSDAARMWYANSAFGYYDVARVGDVWRFGCGSLVVGRNFSTSDNAKRAAFFDYEQRILSALIPGSGVSEEIAKPSEAEFLEWLDRAYNHPGNDGRNFTKWNMEVAFHAGIAWARGRRE